MLRRYSNYTGMMLFPVDYFFIHRGLYYYHYFVVIVSNTETYFILLYLCAADFNYSRENVTFNILPGVRRLRSWAFITQRLDKWPEINYYHFAGDKIKR